MIIGYFTYQNIRVAETFMFDLIRALEKRTSLIWFSGQRKVQDTIAQEQIAAGFSTYDSTLSLIAFKIGQLKGQNGYVWRMKIRLLLANIRLSKLDKNALPDVAYIDFLTSAILLRSFFEKKKIPYVVHVHGYDITSELNDPEYKKEIAKVFKSAEYIISASEYIKRLLILEGCPPEKIVLIRLGIDIKNIIPLSWEKRKKNNPAILFLGRLVAKKNPIALLHAFDIVRKKLPEVTLTIIGQGPLRKEIENRIYSLGLESSVYLAGALSREESFSIMNEHWIYAQHSVCALSGDKEGYAISPAEAAAHELPVVSTIHNGIPEHVIDGVTGFLVPEFDFEKMAEYIIYLIENPDIAEEMGKAGRKNISQINNNNDRVDSIYKLLVKANREKIDG